MFTYIVLICGGIWYLGVQIICLKHFHQGGRRMLRDMERDYEAGPRIGQARSWEPGERMEIRFMQWGTVVMMVLMGILCVTLQPW